MPPKSPSILGAFPLIGALGLATRLLFSCPALLGNVGNISLLFGFGSSLTYGCARTSAAEGRDAGFRASREVSRVVPVDVRKGNLARRTEPVVRGLVEGRRRDFAWGRRLKSGQVVGVGIPMSSKIFGKGVS